MQAEFIVPLIIVAIVVLVIGVGIFLSISKKDKEQKVDDTETNVTKLDSKLKSLVSKEELLAVKNSVVSKEEHASLSKQYMKDSHDESERLFKKLVAELEKKITILDKNYKWLELIEKNRVKGIQERIAKLEDRIQNDESAETQPAYYLDSEYYDQLKALRHGLTFQESEEPLMLITSKGPFPILRYATPLTAIEEKAVELHKMATELYKSCCKL